VRRLSLFLVASLLVVSCESAQQKAPEAPKAPKAPKAGGPEREKPAPLQAAAWLNSEPLALDALEGKVVVLDFWNTMCAPCRKLVPHLAKLYDKHKAEGLVVIGISEEEKPDVEAFLKKIPVSYPLAIDKFSGTGQTFNAYGIGAIPTTWLIGRDGFVAWKGPGAKLTDEMILAELARK